MVHSRLAVGGGGVVLVALLVFLSAVPLPVAAFVEGSPDLLVSAPDNRLEPGERTTLQVSVLNEGEVDNGGSPSLEEQVTTARSLRVSLGSGDAPVDVRTGRTVLGTLPNGASAGTGFRLDVDEDAEPGRYRLPVTLEYSYTNQIDPETGFTDEDSVTERVYVTVVVEEAARFEVVDTSIDAPIGSNGDVSVTVENTGSATAEDATVTLASRTPDLQFGGGSSTATFVGDVPSGERRTVTVPARIAADATVREHPVSVTLDYETTNGVPARENRSIGIVPDAENRIDVQGVESTAAPGESGELELRLRNDGDRTLRDAVVNLQTNDEQLRLGGSAAATVHLGTWEPGETRTVTVDSAFGNAANNRSYPVETTVSYTTADGRQASSRSQTVGVRPADEQTFDVTDRNTTLRVGEEGTLGGTLVNRGPAAVEDAVLVLEAPGTNVEAAETEYALGDLGAGDAAAFSFDLEVSTSARSGPRQFTYHVRYEGTDGETRTSDPINVRTDVHPERDVFTVRAERATFEAGDSGRMVVAVTNAGDRPLTDVSAKLFTNSPLSTSDDEAFVSELAPGETRELVFGVGVSGGAMAKSYPVSIDFQYTEPDGDTKLSNTYRLPVTVRESENGFPFAVGLGAVGIALAIGTALRFR